jgi:hypothetical protein
MSNQHLTEEQFWAALYAMPAPEPVFFRLYHDDQGRVLFYSMEDLPGTYIEIDAETFARSHTNMRVKDGKLVEIARTTSAKLIPGDTGTPCDPTDVSIVVSEQQPNTKWSKRTYESN